ncbi:hypothetical protein PI125_g22776 [Phytophthora idaei]|nr:hypothetical protein PI125_g22776 [Phytophthora idaei]
MDSGLATFKSGDAHDRKKNHAVKARFVTNSINSNTR